MRKLKYVFPLLLTPLFGCDDGTLPTSEYEEVDVNVHFYFPNGTEVDLGSTRGA